MTNAYHIIRAVFIFVTVGVTVTISRKNRSKFKHRRMILFWMPALALLFSGIIASFPMENLFLTFDSPRDVLLYMYGCEAKVLVNGKDSCLVAYEPERGSHATLCIPKTEHGYELPGLWSSKEEVENQFFDMGEYRVIRAHNTNDYYVWTYVVVSSSVECVTDAYGKEFLHTVSSMGSPESNMVEVFSYHENKPSTYTLYVDNELVFQIP